MKWNSLHYILIESKPNLRKTVGEMYHGLTLHQISVCWNLKSSALVIMKCACSDAMCAVKCASGHHLIFLKPNSTFYFLLGVVNFEITLLIFKMTVYDLEQKVKAHKAHAISL